MPFRGTHQTFCRREKARNPCTDDTASRRGRGGTVCNARVLAFCARRELARGLCACWFVFGFWSPRSVNLVMVPLQKDVKQQGKSTLACGIFGFGKNQIFSETCSPLHLTTVLVHHPGFWRESRKSRVVFCGFGGLITNASNIFFTGDITFPENLPVPVPVRKRLGHRIAAHTARAGGWPPRSQTKRPPSWQLARSPSWPPCGRLRCWSPWTRSSSGWRPLVLLKRKGPLVPPPRPPPPRHPHPHPHRSCPRTRPRPTAPSTRSSPPSSTPAFRARFGSFASLASTTTGPWSFAGRSWTPSRRATFARPS